MLALLAYAVYLLNRRHVPVPLVLRISETRPAGAHRFLRKHCFPATARFSHQDLWCSARLGGRLVGLCSLHPHRDHWLLSNNCVHPRYRRRGISTQMLNKLMKHAKSVDVDKKVRLYVDEKNTAALATVAKCPELVRTGSIMRNRKPKHVFEW